MSSALNETADGSGIDERCPDVEELVPFSDATKAIAMVIFIFTSTYLPLTILWWFVRRNKYELKKRSFFLMNVSALGCFVNVYGTSYVTWQGSEVIGCDLQTIISNITLPLLCGSLVARLALFYNQHRFTRTAMEENRSHKLERAKEHHLVVQNSPLMVLRSIVSLTFSKRSDPKVGANLSVFSQTQETASVQTRETNLSRTKLIALKFLKSRHFYPSLVVLFFVSVGAVPILMKFLDETSPYGGLGCIGCELEFEDTLSLTVVLIFTIVSSIYILRRLRGVKDPLDILFELRFVAYVAGPLSLSGMLLALLDVGQIESGRQFSYYLIPNLAALMVHTIQCPGAVLRTYHESGKDMQNTKELSEESLSSLKSVLANKSARDKFAEHLASEFSIENLWFYEAVIRYKSKWDASSDVQVFNQARDIFYSFIQDKSMLEVNIQSADRGELKKNYEHCVELDTRPPKDLFDIAQQAVFRLMESDSFGRFCKKNHDSQMVQL